MIFCRIAASVRFYRSPLLHRRLGLREEQGHTYGTIPLVDRVFAGRRGRGRASAGAYGFAPAQTYQKALFAAGVPATAFITNNIDSEYGRLKTLGVSFRGEPKSMGPITAVLFEDTYGNLINLVQPTP
jgi:hypothetical protein